MRVCAASLRGYVRLTEGGAPQAHARVDLLGTGKHANKPVRRVWTDSQGRFRLGDGQPVRGTEWHLQIQWRNVKADLVLVIDPRTCGDATLVLTPKTGGAQ